MAVIVGPEHVAKTRDLIAECPVWVVRTPESERIASEIRRDATADLTVFTGSTDAEETLLDVLPEVDLHHGEPGGKPPISQIDVFGVEPSEPVRRELDSMGLPSVTLSAAGFVACAEKP